MGEERKKDPYSGFRFRIEIGGIISAGFAECSGLQSEVEYERYQEGGVNEYVHKLPKITKYPNITLKRGLTDAQDLWKWYLDVVNGKVQRKQCIIVLMGRDQEEEKWRWTFQGAYPVKWTGPELRANSNAVAFEAVELVHTGILSEGK